MGLDVLEFGVMNRVVVVETGGGMKIFPGWIGGNI